MRSGCDKVDPHGQGIRKSRRLSADDKMGQKKLLNL